MSNTGNTLPEELLKEMDSYACRVGPRYSSPVTAIKDAAERYYILATRHATSKLHLLQQEYDKLKDENERLHSSFDNLMTAHEKLQKEKLQNESGVIETWRKKEAEYDKLKMQSELNYEVLVSEYKALQDKADKMEFALIEISSEPHSYGEAGSTWGDSQYDSMSAAAGYNAAIDNVSAKANAALSSYNSNNQNENNER